MVFSTKKGLLECKPEWNREAVTVFSRLPSLRRLQATPPLQTSLVARLYNVYSLFLGNDTTFQFDQCNEAFCSEKSIEYDAPKSQLSILLEDSPRCTQELTFHCFMAPVMVSAIFVF